MIEVLFNEQCNGSIDIFNSEQITISLEGTQQRINELKKELEELQSEYFNYVLELCNDDIDEFLNMYNIESNEDKK